MFYRLITRCVVSGALLTVTASAASVAFQNTVAASNPLLWYKMNETSGTTVANSGSVSGLDGTLFNNPALGAAGDGGDTGVAFDGTQGQYVQTANNAPNSVLGNPTFTAEALVFIPSSGQPANPDYAPFLWWGGNGTGNSAYFSLSDNDSSKVFVGFYNGGDVMTGSLTLDSWNLITWVRDSGGGSNGSWDGNTLYINGVAASTTPDPILVPFGGSDPAVNIQAGPFTVERAGDASRFFTGTVDEVALFGTALSAQTVADQFQALGQTSTPEPGTLTMIAGAIVLAGLGRLKSRKEL